MFPSCSSEPLFCLTSPYLYERWDYSSEPLFCLSFPYLNCLYERGYSRQWWLPANQYIYIYKIYTRQCKQPYISYSFVLNNVLLQLYVFRIVLYWIMFFFNYTAFPASGYKFFNYAAVLYWIMFFFNYAAFSASGYKFYLQRLVTNLHIIN